MTIIFHDTFTGTGTLATHTTDSGHTWVDQVTDYESPANFVLADGLTQLPFVYSYIRPGVSHPDDFVLTIEYLHTPADGYPSTYIGQWLSIYFDSITETSNDVGYRLILNFDDDGANTSYAQLTRPPYGAANELFDVNFVSTMGSHTIVIERVGSTITLTRNGVVLASTPLVPKLAGSTIWQVNTGGPGTYLDSYTLSTPALPPPVFWQDIHGATEIP